VPLTHSSSSNAAALLSPFLPAFFTLFLMPSLSEALLKAQ
jgi:hypothetical protein